MTTAGGRQPALAMLLQLPLLLQLQQCGDLRRRLQQQRRRP